MTDLTKVASYINRQDAEIAKGILEEKGINCFISSDDLAGLRPHLTLTGEGVSLVVATNDFIKAQEALKILEIPSADNQEGDEDFEIFKLRLNAKSFLGLVLLTVLEAIIGTWFLWHSASLKGNGKSVSIIVGITFLLLSAVGIIPCRTTYKARKKINEKAG